MRRIGNLLATVWQHLPGDIGMALPSERGNPWPPSKNAAARGAPSSASVDCSIRTCLASDSVRGECQVGREKRKRFDRRPATKLVESLCRTGLTVGAHQTFYLSYKSLQQGRLIALLPDQVKRYRELQVDN
jgi:hypothetical protein